MEIVADVFNCLLEMIIAAFFFSAFRSLRVSKKVFIFVVLGTASLYSLLLTVVKPGFMVLFISIILTFLIALCYRFSWYNAVFMTVIISVLSALSEIVSTVLLTMWGKAVEFGQENIYTYIISFLLSKFLTGIVIVAVYKGRHKLFQSARGNHFLGILFLPLASIFVMCALADFVRQYDADNMLKILSVISVVFLVAANVTIFYVVDRQYELISTKQKLKMSKVLLENQRLYYDSVFESQQEIRKIRHDLKHSFMAVLTKIDTGEIEEARNLVKRQLSETERNIYLSSRETDNIIQSVIYTKKELAKSQQVELDATVSVHQQINMDDLDLAVLLGNLLDNSIEAVVRLEEPRRRVELTLQTDRGKLLIFSSNPVLENINTKRLGSIKSDKKNHGFGLLSIKSIVEKYNGFCTISCENNVFSFTASIPNDE